jgi:diphosphomevalonate decarboxylase
MSFLAPFRQLTPTQFETTWRSPSNIAFVKYWGKKGHQIPANPSLSMTLKECYTETKVSFTPSDHLKVELYLDGVREEKFSHKIEKYLSSLLDLSWLQKINVNIQTKNTFPHGTGIASSASGLSAFALCLTDYLFHLSGEKKNFYPTASYLSRLASGSACRSVYGNFVSWGDKSDFIADQVEFHPDFLLLKDSVLVISGEEKKVSSTSGHGRMSEHSFSEARYIQAKKNYDSLSSSLKSGDLEHVGKILESEALSLHAMMLTSPNPYTLLRPNTLAAIEMIWSFRSETKLPLYFTLDAGPNLHLIYPESCQNKIQTFISHELSSLIQNVIHDERGEGPIRC